MRVGLCILCSCARVSVRLRVRVRRDLAVNPTSLSEANMPTDVTQLMQEFKSEIQRLAPQPEDITF